MKYQIINSVGFAGVHTRKGKRQIRYVHPTRKSVQWIPVKPEREMLVCDCLNVSTLYIPKAICSPGDIPEKGAYGPNQDTVWLHKLPNGAMLREDWHTDCHDGPSHWPVTVKAGSRVFFGDGGCAHMAGFVWVHKP